MLEMTAPAANLSPSTPIPSQLIQPIGVKALYGIAFHEDALLALDPYRGYLLKIDPLTSNAVILGASPSGLFDRATGLALWGETLWFTRDHSVFSCGFPDFTTLQARITLPYTADGVAIWEDTAYVTCKKAGYIFVYDCGSGQRITQFPAPGIGIENIAVWGDYLWVCDQLEQTVYCLDRATGEILLKAMTPLSGPTGIAVRPQTSPDQGTLWLSYVNEVPYVRDNPNGGDIQFELTFRDTTLVHPMQFAFNPDRHCCLSNGFLLEMAYVEEIDSLAPFELDAVEWRMALPTDSDRQKVRSVEPVGLPFSEEVVNGQRVAVFKFDRLTHQDQHVFGWKALVEVHGIKYNITPRMTEKSPPLPPQYQTRYLLDDDELAMDTPLIQQAAKAAVRTETNLLRQVLTIRNYVYDCLSYAVTPAIDPPDVVLQRGRGSCGEYVGVLLALLRLNGIACRTVGRYKCPPHVDQPGIFLEPDFNHVWIEFFIPGFGWVPMESNPDDVQEGGPYPTRFLMGLPWWHVEMGKDIPFEKIRVPDDSPGARLGDIAVNHVRFKILGEIPPWAF